MEIPYISDVDLEEHARNFLDRFAPDRVIPIPIDIILEQEFVKEVIPVTGFSERYGIVGYISTDMETFWVDEPLPEVRYRFTVAHEIAHILLHKNFIRENCPADITAWKQWLIGRDPKLYTRMEVQANRLAGMILLPREQLVLAWEDAKEYAEERGVDVSQIDDFLIGHLAARVAKEFNVAGKVVEIALRQYGMLT